MAGIAPENKPNNEVEIEVTPGNADVLISVGREGDPIETASLLPNKMNVSRYSRTLPKEEDENVRPLLHQGASTRSPSTMSVTSPQEDAKTTLPRWNPVGDFLKRLIPPAEEKRDVTGLTPPPTADSIWPPGAPNAPLEECDCDSVDGDPYVPSTLTPIVGYSVSSTYSVEGNISEEGDDMTREKVMGVGQLNGVTRWVRNGSTSSWCGTSLFVLPGAQARSRDMVTVGCGALRRKKLFFTDSTTSCAVFVRKRVLNRFDTHT